MDGLTARKGARRPTNLRFSDAWLVLAIAVAMTGLAVPAFGQAAAAAGTPAAWTVTGSLGVRRQGHTATLLPDGRVLVAGGVANIKLPREYLDSAELYDPATGKWSMTGRMNRPRAGHAATLLNDGRVLVAGGCNTSIPGYADCATAELYDPATGTWSLTGSLSEGRWFGHTATLLRTGEVLVAGGNWRGNNLTELFHPDSGTWTVAGPLQSDRWYHTATMLTDGRVMVAGGAKGAIDGPVLDTVELFDPAAATWSPAGKLPVATSYHTATPLLDGRVLVAGGMGAYGDVLADAQLFDPTTGNWSLSGTLNVRRFEHTATLMPDGKVLVAAGNVFTSNAGELFSPQSATWQRTPNLNVARSRHTATLLTNGKVLVAGGAADAGLGTETTLDSAELYEPAVPPANSFRMAAIFSDQAGLNQYVQFYELSGLDDQHHFAGLTLQVTSRKGVVKRFTFPGDLPSALTARRPVLVGSPHQAPPDTDFELPAEFLPTDGGTLVFAGVDVWDYPALPTDGGTTLLRGNFQVSNPPCGPPGYIFRPFTGFPTALGVWVDPAIEYYNASLDHYFVSSSQPDIDALDSGRIPGWIRTGESFPVWITRETCGQSPPTLAPVCRLYIPPAFGNSHFFSVSAAECSGARALHPELILETNSAFFASLPDAQTGACPYDQIPVFRLWNGRADSNHRYTIWPATRDLMVSRGYVAEGYGPNSVAMCVGGRVYQE